MYDERNHESITQIMGEQGLTFTTGENEDKEFGFFVFSPELSVGKLAKENPEWTTILRDVVTLDKFAYSYDEQCIVNGKYFTTIFDDMFDYIGNYIKLKNVVSGRYRAFTIVYAKGYVANEAVV